MKTLLGESLGNDLRIGARGGDNLPILPWGGFTASRSTLRRRSTLSRRVRLGFLHRRGGCTFRTRRGSLFRLRRRARPIGGSYRRFLRRGRWTRTLFWSRFGWARLTILRCFHGS